MHPRLTRIAPIGLALAATLAVPAVAQAKPHTATVLRIDRAHHRIELVDRRHVVRNYVVGAKLPHRLSRGSVVSYSAHGKRVTKLRLKGHARKLRYIGKVVASGKGGVVLKLADGRRVRLGGKGRHAAHRVRAAGTVSIEVQGLKVGQVVMITEASDASGNVTITIKLIQQQDSTSGEDQTVTGAVTAVAADGSTLTVQVDGKGPMTFQTDPDVVNGVSVGDQVDVTYYQDTDGSLVADDVQPSNSGSPGDGSTDQDAVGTVTAVATDGSTLTVQVDGKGPVTFQTDSDLVDGISVGDLVDVTYYQDTDGSLVADDVQPADNSSSGSGDSSGSGSGDGSGDGSGG
jgi:hypothetical protein